MGDTVLWTLSRRSHQTLELTILFQICLLLPFNLPFLLFLLERKQHRMMLWEKCQYSAPTEKRKKSARAGAAESCSLCAKELNSVFLHWLNRSNLLYLGETAFHWWGNVNPQNKMMWVWGRNGCVNSTPLLPQAAPKGDGNCSVLGGETLHVCLSKEMQQLLHGGASWLLRLCITNKVLVPEGAIGLAKQTKPTKQLFCLILE